MFVFFTPPGDNTNILRLRRLKSNKKIIPAFFLLDFRTNLIKSFSIIMKAKQLLTFFYFLGCFFTSSLLEASTIQIPTVDIVPTEVTIDPPVFKPIKIERNLALQIDEEKSFFEIRKQPDDTISFGGPWYFRLNYYNGNYNFETYEKFNESKIYTISGKIELNDKYYESESIISFITKITSISFDSKLSNIDFDTDYFWSSSEKAREISIYLEGGWIEASTPLPPPYYSTHKGATFDGESLLLFGDGNFKLDEASGLYVIQSDESSTHRIRYHIEANVVNTIPVPSAIYLFLSGLGVLTGYRKYLRTV